MDRAVAESIRISLPNIGAVGTVDKTARKNTLVEKTKAATETEVGRAALLVLDFVGRAWADRVRLAKCSLLPPLIVNSTDRQKWQAAPLSTYS